MQNIKKYFMTLALLLTAATGAWAQGEFSSDPYTSTTEFNSVSVTSSMTLTIKEGVIVTVNSGLTIEDGVTLTLTGGGRLSVYGKTGNWGRDAVYEEEFCIDEATAGGDGQPAIILNDNAKIVIDNGEIYAEGGQGGRGGTDEIDGINQPDGAEGKAFSRFPTIDGATLYYKSSDEWFKYTSGDQTLYREMKAVPPTIDVTLNDPKTEASFDMPTDDVTVNYELVRDMSVQMTATMGDGTDGLRYRVKKSEQNPGKYEPADMNMLQVLTLVAVNDGIEQKDLTLEEDYFCRIYKLDEQTQQPEGDGVELFEFDFAPGLYALKAFATDGSNYDGETALSNTFKLFEGYELKIAAGEYATYYKDEALYVEDTDAQLYTITSVNGDKANVVQVDVAKANMPILVKNNSADEKTILLIPTSEQTPDEVSAAEEFVGTLTATQIAASDATTERYAFNGKEFVWVKDAIAVGANRAWLEVPTSFAAGAHAIELVFDGETTRILSVENGELRIENYDYIYNLSGQRVSKDYKGVVVVNGKKVIRK